MSNSNIDRPKFQFPNTPEIREQFRITNEILEELEWIEYDPTLFST